MQLGKTQTYHVVPCKMATLAVNDIFPGVKTAWGTEVMLNPWHSPHGPQTFILVVHTNQNSNTTLIVMTETPKIQEAQKEQKMDGA